MSCFNDFSRMFSPISVRCLCRIGMPVLQPLCLDTPKGPCCNARIMKVISTRRLLVIFTLICLMLSLSLQGTARAQMDTSMMFMSVTQMDTMDNCGGCGDDDTLLNECISGTCISVPATLNNASAPLQLPGAILRASLPHFHRSLPPVPEPQPPRRA